MTVPDFGYTALGPDDQDDAARRQPSSNLAGWAASRGLEYRGSEVPGAFASVLPGWPQHLMNLSKGPFAGEHFGVIAHRLYELEAFEGKIRVPGDYWGSRFTNTRSLKSFAGISMDEDSGPFDGNRIFAPTTTAAVRAPEAALLPGFIIRNGSRMGKINSPKLAEFGLPHLRMAGSQFIDDEMLARLATAVAPTLATFDEPLVEAKYAYGAVVVTVNGYRDDPEFLDRMMAGVAAMADALGALAASLYPPIEPLDFAGSWGPVDPASHPPGSWIHGDEWTQAYSRAAGERRMVEEDPIAFMRHIPHCPVPGIADGVLKGELATEEGPVRVRLSWHVQGGITSGSVRPAACFVAPPNAPEGPFGGVHDPHSDMYLEVRDGLLFVWGRARIAGRLNSEQLLANAAAWWQRYASAR